MSRPLWISMALLTLLTIPAIADHKPLTAKDVPLNAQKVQRKLPVIKASFSPFTGKVKGEKVRLRLQPDLDGHVIRELTKNEIVAVVDQEGDFYAIETPEQMKAYVFRSFVLDNVVEGNRVNVRIDPDLDAPIIGHLNSGDHVEGLICAHNKKWLEIPAPSSIRFYVSKEYIETIGGPELKEQMVQRQGAVNQLLEAAKLFADSEMIHPFEEINFEQVKQGFLTIVHDYTDFPHMIEQAKEALTKIQEDYLQKRIAYLEEKAALVSSGATSIPQNQMRPTTQLTGQPLQMWHAIEDALYASWADANDHKDKNTFYEDQKLVAISISGVLETYKTPIKNRPGDYVIKHKNIPIAYVYSTKVNLDDYVGKKVTLKGSRRPNNNFAFPAYFIHDVE